MIDELIVSNLGLIERAHLEPGEGLTVITGETGTGKTLLLGALRLLLGESTKPDLVGPFADEARVDGRFVSTDGSEVAATRRMPRSGRSRAYLDGLVASAAALDEITHGLVEIIGQHDQLTLTRPAEARRLVDEQLDPDGRDTLLEYRQAWAHHQELIARQAKLGGDRRALERERDLADYQALEIEGAGFVAGDDSELEVELSRLRHASEIAEMLGSSTDSVETSRETLGDAVSTLRKAARLDPGLEDIETKLGDIEQQLGEIAIEVNGRADGLDTDPTTLARAEERFARLSDLKRKYGSTLDDVLGFGKEVSQRSSELTELLDSADRISSELEESQNRLVTTALTLTEARRRAGEALSGSAVEHLQDLGLSDPVISLDLQPVELGPYGGDRVALTFASDSRLVAGDLGKVASGGELSRLVLALRLAGGAGEAETLVFDEIDAGVGGATAIEIGRKLADLANTRQVLCVTHLPQVAAFAAKHYRIERHDARAELAEVVGDERIDELSRMLAGTPDVEATRQAAIELLNRAG